MRVYVASHDQRNELLRASLNEDKATVKWVVVMMMVMVVVVVRMQRRPRPVAGVCGGCIRRRFRKAPLFAVIQFFLLASAVCVAIAGC